MNAGQIDQMTALYLRPTNVDRSCGADAADIDVIIANFDGTYDL